MKISILFVGIIYEIKWSGFLALSPHNGYMRSYKRPELQ